MKRTHAIAIFVLMLTAVGAVEAQQTLIPWNQRKADLYYWGSNWVDSNLMASPNENLYQEVSFNISDLFIGRACVTSLPMRVIGIAAPVKIDNTGFTPGSTSETRLPEYYRLYQQEGDSIVLVKEIRWDTATPSFLFEERAKTWLAESRDTFDLYEAFFEKPIMVHDTFYVGGTTHNNLGYGNHPDHPNWFMYLTHRLTQYGIFYRCCWPEHANAHAIAPNPPYYIRKYFWPYDVVYPLPNNNNNGITFDTTTMEKVVDSIRWLPFFAIFDTNFVQGMGTYDDSCLAPEGLHIEGMVMDGVTLAWNAGGETMWKLSVAPLGTNVNNGLLIQTPINYVEVSGLDTAQWYVARVLTMCDTDVFGDWSDTLMFYLPGLGDTCLKPQNLQASVSEGEVVLQWSVTSNMSHWELEMGMVEMGMTGSQVYDMNQNWLTTAVQYTDAWYWARVRTVCGEDFLSDWTDTIRFFVPSTTPDNPDTTGNGISPVEQYTYLMPNPAREEVTVASSFRVKAVELYGADGKLLQQKEVNAVGTTMDLKGLPAGIYFVRVHTTAGVTTKRLIIE